MLKTYADFRIEVPSGRSGEVATTCPECSSSRKKKRARCLSVNVDKGVWHCNHCGWTGSLESGIGRAELHWQRPQWRRPEPLEVVESARMLEFFAGRGIPADVVRRNGITTARVYMPQVEEEVRAIAFPYLRDGEVVNHKYRDHHKNFRMDAGAERILYGLADLAESTVIVEGEMDKLSIEAAGFRACVSVPDGAPAVDSRDYAHKFDFLDDQRLEAVQCWIVAVDNDAPGQRLEDELARRLGREKCRRVVWPQGCKDANDVLVKHGPQALADCLAEAQPYPIKGVFEVMDVADRVYRLYEHGWEKGVPTGWDAVDPYYTVRPGEFTVVTGIPNSGKSNWVDALMVNLARDHGWRFGVFSPENQPIEDHIARIAEKYLRKSFGEGPTARMSREEMEGAMRWVNAHFFWILPDDDAEWTLESVLESARALVKRHGIRGLVVDPWNELEHMRERDMTETEYISRSLKHYRQFARRNGVHAWMVAHPSKLYRDKEGNYPVPTLYDISGSAHWRNKADNGLCLWRDFRNDHAPVQVHVQKIRFRQIGKIGQADLTYSKPTQTYHDVNAGQRYRDAKDGRDRAAGES